MNSRELRNGANTDRGKRERETDALTSAAADFDFCFSTVVVVVASMMFSSVLSSLSSPAAAAVRLGMIHDERRVEGRQDSRQDGDQFGCLPFSSVFTLFCCDVE